MSLTTEEIIGGMYRAHRAGQPFAALAANPQFANLPLETKQEVLLGLRARMGGESTSAVNALLQLIKGTAGGALSAVPLGAVLPVAMEMSETGATRKSVLAALKGAAENKRVQAFMGIGAGVGAAAGLTNAALRIYRNHKDRENFKEGLEEAAKGGEDLAAASFGAIGGHGAPMHFNVKPVVDAFSAQAISPAIAAARLNHYNVKGMDYDPHSVNSLHQRVKTKMMQGHPIDPDALASYAQKVHENQQNYQNMNNIVVNSYQDLNLKPDDANAVLGDIQGGIAANEENLKSLNALEQVARRVRDMKRGVE